MDALKFFIRYPDRAGEELVVDTDLVHVGSGPHCEVRLPREHAAREHVQITLAGGLVHARARATRPPPLLDGLPFEDARVPPGSTLQIGGVKIEIEVFEAVTPSRAVARRGGKPGVVGYLGAAVCVPLALVMVLGRGSADPAGEAPSEVPPLFGEERARCPQAEPEPALSLALERRAVAEGKHERAPFHVQDGIEAVPLYELSAACFEASGQAALAGEAREAAAALRRELLEAYQAHRTRLEHTRRVGDLKAAQQEAKTLLAMLAGQSAPYVTWLSNLERQLEVKLGRPRSKR